MQIMPFLFCYVYMPSDIKYNDLYCNILIDIMNTCPIMNCSNVTIGVDLKTTVCVFELYEMYKLCM